MNAPELTTRLADALGAGNADMAGVPTESYEVFYSNGDGTFNPNGEYLTIEGMFLQGLPQGGDSTSPRSRSTSAAGRRRSSAASSRASSRSATTRYRTTSRTRSTATFKPTRRWATRSARRSGRVTVGFRSATGGAAVTASDIPTLADYALVLLAAAIAMAAWFAMRGRVTR